MHNKLQRDHIWIELCLTPYLLGVLLTAIYIYGLIFRPKRQFCCLGIDSIVVLVTYIVGTVGLFTISGS